MADVPTLHDEESSEKSGGLELYGMLHDLVYILAVVTIVFVFVIRLVGVSGSSMYPTLNDKDYLGLLSNVFYQNPQQGDVVVATVPYFEERDEGPIVKRVIATEGQTVDIDFDAGEVYVDGVMLDESYINEKTFVDFAQYGQSMDYPVVVEEDHVFLMGDNRNHSTDSRFAPVGQVAQEDLLGKVLFLIWPGEDTTTEKRDFSRIGAVS